MSLPPADPALESQFPMRHDRAIAYLRSLLLDGGLDPNHLISTDEVAQALRISRAPVTDAIKRLAQDGFLTVMPQVGCRVHAPQPQEVADFYRIFAKSEAVVNAIAAERRTPAQASTLKELNEELEGRYRKLSAAEHAGPQLRALNRRRYDVIHNMANSEIAARLVAHMCDRSDFYIRVAYGEFVYAPSVHRANRKITQAIVRGDGATAADATETYLTTVGIRAAEALQRRLKQAEVAAER